MPPRREPVVRNYRRMVVAAVIVSILLTPTAARAQAAIAEPNTAADDFDAAVYVAWFGGKRGNIGGDTFRDWYSTLLGSAGVGHYWTEHLKTEAELAVTGRGNLVSFEDQHREPFVTRYVYRDHTYQLVTLSLVQSYQFRQNAWVHPFVGAGLDIDWERRAVEGSVQVTDSSGSEPVFSSEPLPRETHTGVIARAVAVTGFKAYVARNAFFRMDLRASVTDGLDQVAWRFGFGWDF
jgi:hypothetical protein